FVFAVDQAHRVAQAVFAMTMLAQGRPFGAVGAEVDRGVEHRFLTDPDAIFNNGVRGTADGTVRTDGAADFDFGVANGDLAVGGAGFAHQAKLGGGNAGAHAQAGTAQESPAVHGGQGVR